ncbi:MAG: DUF3718 domain-containing protein [Kangiellaceae bacterium]|nr:DUF3718 domain-containing protein [Kangiellaceae bacterium]MCW8998726.1 DUF3718 domain-containing protein [Kangiellaceae bacterium]MCW9017983.1 DUF3718 domain-containing protein [Kangiellaceae bacterium]
MKLLKSSLAVTLLALSTSSFAANYEFIAADKTIGTQLCIAAVENNVDRLKDKASELPIASSVFSSKNLKVVAKKQKCNDINIVKFAQQYGANDSVKLLAKYLHREVLVHRVSDISPNKPKVIVVSGR